MNAYRQYPRMHRQDACTDQVVGAILSGWRYDISGISPDLRGDYEDHLSSCQHCRKRQRLHRTVDVLLLAVTTLSFVAFLMAALVVHRLEVARHIADHVNVPLHHEGAVALSRIPDSVQISMEAVAVAGVVLSLLLWVLVAIVTPIPAMVTEIFRQRVQPELRDRLRKQAA